jgi:hypothetical protein
MFLDEYLLWLPPSESLPIHYSCASDQSPNRLDNGCTIDSIRLTCKPQ